MFQQFNLIPYLNAIETVQLATQFGDREKPAARLGEIEALLDEIKYFSAGLVQTSQQSQYWPATAGSHCPGAYQQPQLLIADEPTSSLDQQNRDNFMSELMSLVTANNITLVFVSHDLSLSSLQSN